MADVEVQIDASRGAITVRGEHSFVNDILEKYKFVFENAPKTSRTSAHSGETTEPSKSSAASNGMLYDLDNVYDIEGDAVSILVAPLGGSLATQARAIILLYLYARYKVGTEPTSADLIKEQCKAHACFDPKNFASHLKSQKSYVTITGGNSSTTARLTVPGRKAALEMAQKLQAGE